MPGLGCGKAKRGKRRKAYVHVRLAREEGLARRVQQQDALDQVQRAQDQQVVLAVAALGDEAVERREQPLRDVPLEALLQLEELAEGRVAREVRERLGLGRVELRAGRLLRRLLGRAPGGRGRLGEADLGEQAFD